MRVYFLVGRVDRPHGGAGRLAALERPQRSIHSRSDRIPRRDNTRKSPHLAMRAFVCVAPNGVQGRVFAPNGA